MIFVVGPPSRYPDLGPNRDVLKGMHVIHREKVVIVAIIIIVGVRIPKPLHHGAQFSRRQFVWIVGDLVGVVAIAWFRRRAQQRMYRRVCVQARQDDG